MKKSFILILLVCGINSIYSQKRISLEAKGNLESPKPCGCIELSKVTNEHNPADILNGMRECIQLEEFDKAAKLFAIAGVFGKYDTYRVKDKTAHQALLVLQQNIFSSFDKDQTDLLFQSLNEILESNSESLFNICSQINEVGKPTYHPKYMIQHGIAAFGKNNGNGLVKRFNSKKYWDLALKSYLKCNQ